MYRILNELKRREAMKNPILVGLVGCGQMGSGMLNLTYQMPGLRISAVADLEVERGIRAFEEVGFSRDQVTVTERVQEAQEALEKGGIFVTPDPYLLSHVASIDAVVEATGSPDVGAEVAYYGTLNSKHVIMLNVETDVTCGWILKRMADQMGVIYTVSAGDEPGAVMELYRFARTLGFRVVTIGKGKNNPVNYYANPDECREEAERKHMNPKMLCAFVDGTKTMVEMAEVSNATGALPDIPGMHGKQVDVPGLSKTYIPRADGGVFERNFVVEYSTGKVAPGVFVVFTSDSEHLRQDLGFYSMGEGPYYTLYRPYHLCSFETPISVARAVITGEPTINSHHFNSEVVTVAKRDLEQGAQIDGIGGFDVFGRIDTYESATQMNALPIGLAAHAKVKKAVAKGKVVRRDDVQVNRGSFSAKLRDIQDSLMAREG